MEYLLAAGAFLTGLALLVWSADKFVDGASGIAVCLRIPVLIIGMVIVGFGTSAPELLVSALAAMDGKPDLSIGNAYGSNIANIALILGVTALFSPVLVRRSGLKREMPVLILGTLLSLVLLWDLDVSRADSLVLLLFFTAVMTASVVFAVRRRGLGPAPEINNGGAVPAAPAPSLGKSVFWLVAGLLVLIASSRLLVWGAAELAVLLGISDIVVGLTVVAGGTSAPELASSIIASRKGHDDLAVGNVVGSNLFNTLAVVGVAGAIQPFSITADVIYRDMLLMTLLALSVFVFGFSRGGDGSICRKNGIVLTLIYVVYTAYLICQALYSQA